jgi:hypothetical protein
METVWQDLRHGARMLVRRPGFTAVVLTLALGIGANTGVFNLIYGILLRPLPYPRPTTCGRAPSAWSATPNVTRRRAARGLKFITLTGSGPCPR